MIKTFNEESYTWNGVDKLVYKADGSPFKDVTRQVLFNGSKDLPVQFRYFEVAPGGYSTLERHEHTHMVMIFRGRGQCLIGEEVTDIKVGDMVVVPSNTTHQFRANQGDYVGFLCLVNQDRDKVQLLSEEELTRLRSNPIVEAFLDSCT